MPIERTYKALLVGNGAFPSARDALGDLYGPPNDVRAMATSLSHADWGLHDPQHIVQLVNTTKAAIEEAMEEFFASATPQDQLLFFYSGHGIHLVHERLFLGVYDTRTDRPHSSAVALSVRVTWRSNC